MGEECLEVSVMNRVAPALARVAAGLLRRTIVHSVVFSVFGVLVLPLYAL
jgi:hypothetical protein